MNSSVQTNVKFLVKKCELLGLIDQTYQIEALYKKGDLQHGGFVLESLREGLQNLYNELEEQD